MCSVTREDHRQIARGVADIVWSDVSVRSQIIENKWSHVNAKGSLEDNLYDRINELILKLSSSGEDSHLIYKKMLEDLSDHVLELTKGPPEPRIVTWEATDE